MLAIHILRNTLGIHILKCLESYKRARFEKGVATVVCYSRRNVFRVYIQDSVDPVHTPIKVFVVAPKNLQYFLWTKNVLKFIPCPNFKTLFITLEPSRTLELFGNASTI